MSQVRAEDTPISGPIIAAKAKQFFEKLGIVGTFDASQGWLTRFKQRHGIREIGLHGDKVSCDNQAAEDFDNASAHSGESVLKSEDGNFFVKFLPPNVTALIQPMDQGVIASMKKRYRTNLLKKRIEEGGDLQGFWKDYTILDSIYDISTAWNAVKITTLVKSWRKILPNVEKR